MGRRGSGLAAVAQEDYVWRALAAQNRLHVQPLNRCRQRFARTSVFGLDYAPVEAVSLSWILATMAV
jgi:hypothetical protein